jgi:Peptidase family M23
MRIFTAGALLLGQLAGQVMVAGPALSGQVPMGPSSPGPVDTARAPASAAAPASIWSWPLSGANGEPPTVVRGFQPPLRRWDPGHRGLDLIDMRSGTKTDIDTGYSTSADTNLRADSIPNPDPSTSPDPITAPEMVHAAGAGTVIFAGTLFGQEVVSISHGALRTSYEPVAPLVHVGEQVLRGEAIGELEPGHCVDRPCLHWGLLTGHGRWIRYYDPSILLGPGRVRLEPAWSR